MSESLVPYGVALAACGVATYALIHAASPPAPQKYRLETPIVRWPLPLVNFVHSALRLVGASGVARIQRDEFIALARTIVEEASKDPELLGDQSDLLRGIEALMDSMNPDIMSASGILLVNGFYRRVLNTRLASQRYLIQNRDAALSSPLVRPFIISGLPRTGSTMLYNLMACDPQGRAPRFFEMSQMSVPMPPCTQESRDVDPRIQQVMDRFDEVERLYPAMFTEAGKSHRSHPNELEEELLILFQGLVLQIHVPLADRTDAFREWFERTDKAAAYRYMRMFLQMMNNAYTPPSHWVLKAPVHSFYMDSLLEQFPDARIVLTHRDPLNVVPSWATLIETYLGWHWIPNTMDRIKYGRYIMDSLKMMSQRIIDWRSRNDPSRYFDVNYERFVKDPVSMVESIYSHYGMEVSDEFRENMHAWIRDNRQGKYGRNAYSLDDYQLTKDQVLEEFSQYIETFLR